VPLVEQELLTLPEHLRSSPVFSGVHVTRSLVFHVLDQVRSNLKVITKVFGKKKALNMVVKVCYEEFEYYKGAIREMSDKS
jgi:hypothetical protein